ncbi:MAG TPA: DoxX family protein [bacterium]|nr:DoxX family protein [bacterium]
MNITLWVLQVLLALHTVMGAIWKFKNPVQAVPSLKAIPHGGWLGISVFELILALGLVLPALHRNLGPLAPLSALCIAAIMLFYCAIHLSSGNPFNGQVAYWLVVLAFCALIAYGRFILKPF